MDEILYELRQHSAGLNCGRWDYIFSYIKKFRKHAQYILQNRDSRVFFAVPWENEFTFIGTTDVDFNDSLDSFAASDDEINYLCKSANQYFRSDITSNDVVKHWSGVRPLYDDDSIIAQ